MSFDIETGLTSLEEIMSQVRQSNKVLVTREQQLDLREEELNKRHAELRKRETALERNKAADDIMAEKIPKLEEVIELNIGGETTATLRSTLTKYDQTFLSAMFSGKFPLTTDSLGKIFIDRPAKPFLSILNWLRTGKWHTPPTTEVEERLLLSEIEYYGLTKYVLQQNSPAVLPGSVSPRSFCLPNTVETPVLVPADHYIHGRPDDFSLVMELPTLSGVRPKSAQRNVSWSWNDMSSCFLSSYNKKAIPKVGDSLLVPVYTDEIITGGECIEIDIIGIQSGLELECGLINGSPPECLTGDSRNGIGFRCDTSDRSKFSVPLMGCVDFTLMMLASWSVPGQPGQLKIFNSHQQDSASWRQVPLHTAEIPTIGGDGWRFAIYSPAGVELIIRTDT